MERELPTWIIEGTEFSVDVSKNEIREKGNLKNKISFDEMNFDGSYYWFEFDKSKKNIPSVFDVGKRDITLVKVANKVYLDPEAMAKKYNLMKEDLSDKTDFEIMVDQAKYIDRANHGKLPVIDIAGNKYFVDLRMQELRLTTDFMTKIDLKDKYVDSRENYQFFYNPSKKEVVTIEDSITQLPKNVVLIQIPTDVKLDPYAVAREYKLDIKDFLIKHPFQKELKAVVTPWSKTPLAKLVELNRKPLLEKTTDHSNKNKGKHL